MHDLVIGGGRLIDGDGVASGAPPCRLPAGAPAAG